MKDYDVNSLNELSEYEFFIEIKPEIDFLVINSDELRKNQSLEYFGYSFEVGV